jgi:hypothetical protein
VDATTLGMVREAQAEAQRKSGVRPADVPAVPPDEPISLEVLVAEFNALPARNRRELRDKAAYQLVATALYIVALHDDKTWPAAVALMTVGLTLLALWTGVFNAIDVLEEQAEADEED